jgi:hypothetical protein
VEPDNIHIAPMISKIPAARSPPGTRRT